MNSFSNQELFVIGGLLDDDSYYTSLITDKEIEANDIETIDIIYDRISIDKIDKQDHDESINLNSKIDIVEDPVTTVDSNLNSDIDIVTRSSAAVDSKAGNNNISKAYKLPADHDQQIINEITFTNSDSNEDNINNNKQTSSVFKLSTDKQITSDQESISTTIDSISSKEINNTKPMTFSNTTIEEATNLIEKDGDDAIFTAIEENKSDIA
eukprot:CAMPEP_0196761460 /NCGR_PEP_ID=MMETSP1095-20130614/697_1 /TAXON_ID=96789 ORGANISM="Chromulina nebulosa, Strain UTEXLB2642" /NCGR_SAMPLE_ID=MMETSP1095 /ASSEMBLY_ACC=CAM_ASM_000446 /LENGTH=210 /DNA_ID=CAMNT_0042111035 /DNA_START=1049 /DNA_END=1678 /DNA_ORIENTATION=+